MNTKTAVLASTIAAALLADAAHAQQPQQTCFPSRHGKDDQVGNLNYVTPEKTLAAAKLVTKGKSYRLGIETNKDTPAFPPRTWSIAIVQPGQVHGAALGPTKTTYNDDIIMGWVGIGSQLDGLGHIGIDGVYYNCNKAAEFAMAGGLTRLGIEKVPPSILRKNVDRAIWQLRRSSRKTQIRWPWLPCVCFTLNWWMPIRSVAA